MVLAIFHLFTVILFSNQNRPSNNALSTNLYLCIFLVLLQTCNIPAGYIGDWYSQEGGADVHTKVEATKWSIISEPKEQLECIDIYEHKQEGIIDGGMDSTMINSTMMMAAMYVFFKVTLWLILCNLEHDFGKLSFYFLILSFKVCFNVGESFLW